MANEVMNREIEIKKYTAVEFINKHLHCAQLANTFRTRLMQLNFDATF